MSDIPMPARYKNAAIAHVMVKGATAAITFYEGAFGAEELFRIAYADGKVLHAEIKIAESVVMVGEAEGEFKDPLSCGGTTVGLHIYVRNLDEFYAKVIETEAEIIQEPTEMFYGARTMMVKDPFGHVWVFLQHTKDMSTASIQKKGNDLLRQ